MPPTIDESIEYERDDSPRELPMKFPSDLDSPSPQQSLHNTPPAPAGQAHQHRVAVGTQLSSLAALPIVRQIPWKDGQALPGLKSIDDERPHIRGALLLTMHRRNVRNVPEARVGSSTVSTSMTCFKELVRLVIIRREALTAPCVWRKKVRALSSGVPDNADSRDLAALGASKPTKSSTKSSALNDTMRVQSEPSLKRKRISNGNPINYKKQPRLAYNLEDVESRYDAAPVPRPSKSVPYDKSFDDDPAALLALLYKQQQRQLQANGSAKRHQVQDNEDEDGVMLNANAYKGPRGGHREEGPEKPYSPAVGYSGPSFDMPNSRIASQDHRRPEAAVALIDTFPRRKQKQLYSVIGGLESGIRSQRQQTENLENQLETLKEILGIGEDAGFV
ncbi:hypothetical protein MBM_08520 [Drepanopeziza brunnea f. sp. 'multigermtubi' MB_m1]|uniref:Uncharacterized protein n=1 Tax=Marssonina brunnea f. sp. multigermtubi (strain MB_m1) TaxID=1072389 RepID=K1WM74_MARBU|nr:uncharacterized protein MBM_08520 [Drepanopeziza brunnea f. sp. 'multigermtubi' MB_m1]EKD13437.1 hypothetical protein MBM_08520 [Drepanopeziza brunnea f. sp. 'multigermtubi' MB_m1]